MIGTILISGTPAIRMEDTGDYTALSARYEPVTDWLNATAHPYRNRVPGDSSRAFGVAALTRAAMLLNDATVKLEPSELLPEGAVN